MLRSKPQHLHPPHWRDQRLPQLLEPELAEEPEVEVAVLEAGDDLDLGPHGRLGGGGGGGGRGPGLGRGYGPAGGEFKGVTSKNYFFY